jgi:GT2 family glycosyltransferase
MRLFCSNTRGLPAIYNIAIEDAKRAPAILVFIHDDVELSDYFWSDNIRAGLLEFDLIGVEGNRRRVPNQMAWAFHDESMVRDAEYLSGSIGKSDHYGRFINYYGPSFQAVKLLDGVLLAARSELFHTFDTRFDEQFDFHFYDLDLCRQAELKGLDMGTWGISIVHESRGAFLSAEWKSAYEKYITKWKS